MLLVPCNTFEYEFEAERIMAILWEIQITMANGTISLAMWPLHLPTLYPPFLSHQPSWR